MSGEESAPKLAKSLVNDKSKLSTFAKSLGVCCMCGWPFDWSGGDPTRLGYSLYKCEHVYMGNGGAGFYARLFWESEASHILHKHLRNIFSHMAVQLDESRRTKNAQFILRFVFFEEFEGRTITKTGVESWRNRRGPKPPDRIKLLKEYTILMRHHLRLNMITKLTDMNGENLRKQIDEQDIRTAETRAAKTFGLDLDCKLAYFFCMTSMHSKRRTAKAGKTVKQTHMDHMHIEKKMPKILQNIFKISSAMSLQVYQTLRNADICCKGGESHDSMQEGEIDVDEDEEEKVVEDEAEEEEDGEEEDDNQPEDGQNEENSITNQRITKSLVEQTIGCCYGCNRQMTMEKEFRHCTACILDLEELPTTTLAPIKDTMTQLFAAMQKTIKSKPPKVHDEKHEKKRTKEGVELNKKKMWEFLERGYYKNHAKTVKGVESVAPLPKPAAYKKEQENRYLDQEHTINYPAPAVSNALYDLMLSLVMMLIDMRFNLLLGKARFNWIHYYNLNKHKVQEHVKYVILCNMHVITCNFMDDAIGKNLKYKAIVLRGDPNGVVQKKHLYRSCAALYTAAIMYESLEMFHHRVRTMVKKPQWGEVDLTMGLTEFWRFVFVECAYYQLQGKQHPVKNACTPYMSIFGVNGLPDSGADVTSEADRIPEKYMKVFTASIKCVSRMWDRYDGRFLLFVHRVVFQPHTNQDGFLISLLNNQTIDANFEELLANAHRLLVSNSVRKRLTDSIANSRQSNPSAPSQLVQNLPTANRVHAVQIFLRMAYIFNQDVQTEIIKDEVRFELNNLYADKQPFGKPT